MSQGGGEEMFSRGEKTGEEKMEQSKVEQPNSDFSTTSTAPRTSSGKPSVINADLRIIGDLESAGDIQVDGTVEGDIRSRTVTVSPGANIKGSIQAETINISGTVNGQVEAPTINISKTANMTGDVIHQILSIEAGAQFGGNCRRLESVKAARAVQTAAQKSGVQPTASDATAAIGKVARV
jgi:cytoskeletal protein CcmA (bactofilin family)